MRVIKLYITCSEDLELDKAVIGNLIRQLNTANKPNGIWIELTDADDSDIEDAVSSDMFVALFHKEADKVSFTSLQKASETYKTANKPKVYIYFKDLSGGEILSDELEKFKEHICTELGHFVNRYNNEDSIKFSIIMQVMQVTGTEQAEVKESKVIIGGEALADLNNIPFAGNNPDYQRLQQNLSQISKDIEIFEGILRDTPNEAIEAMLRQKLVERVSVLKNIEEFGSSLLETARLIATVSQTNSSTRLRKAIELFEKGDNKGANAILDFDEINSEMEVNARNFDLSHEILKANIEALKANIEECSLKINTLKTEKSNNWLSQCCDIFKKAIDITKGRLTVENIKLLTDYADLLLKNNILGECLSICGTIQQAHDDCKIEDKSSIQELYPQFLAIAGSVNLRLKRYTQAEDYYLRAIRFYCELQEPRINEIAKTHMNLAGLYCEINNYKKADSEYTSATKLYEELINKYPGKYEEMMALCSTGSARYHHIIGEDEIAKQELLRSISLLKDKTNHTHENNDAEYAIVLGNLAALYCDNYEYVLAIENYNQAYKLYEGLIQQSPDAYEPIQANILRQLGVTYGYSLNFERAKEYFNKSITLYRRLVALYPEAYSSELAITLCQVASLNRAQNDYELASKQIKEAFNIYKELSNVNPGAFEPSLADTANNLALVFQDYHQYSSALDYFQIAHNIYGQLSENHPEVYLTSYAWSYQCIAGCYKMLNRDDEAALYYSRSIELNRILTKNNPGLNECKLASALCDIGSFHWAINKYEDARKEMIEAAEIYKRYVLDNPSFEPDYANILGNLATLDNDLHNNDAAFKEYNEAIGLYRKLCSGSPDVYLPDLARILNNSAHLYLICGDYESAESHYTEVIRIFREYASSSPDVYLLKLADALSNFGAANRYLKRYKDSENNLKEALEILIKLRDTDENNYELVYQIGRCRGIIANLYEEQGRYVEAEDEYMESLTLYKILAKGSPEAYKDCVALTLSNIGCLYYMMEEYDKSIFKFKEAIDLYRELDGLSFNAYAQELARTYSNLAKSYIKKGQRQDAITQYQESVIVYEHIVETAIDAYGEEYLTAIDRLAKLLFDDKQYKPAAERYADAVRVYKQLEKVKCKSYNSCIANDLSNIALCHKLCHDYAASEKEYLEAIELFDDDDLKQDPQKHIRIYSNLALIKCQLGKFEDSKYWYTRTISLCAYSDEFKEDLAFCKKELGRLHFTCKEYKQAEQLLMESIDEYKDIPQEKRSMAALAEAYNTLSYVFFYTNRKEDSLRAINNCLELSPLSPNYLDSKGEFLLLNGDIQGALEMWAQIINIDPEFDKKVNSALYEGLKEKGLV